MDIGAIGAAIAARYASGTLVPPPGLPAVRLATADLPNNVPARGPVVLVLPDNGTLEAGNQTRLGVSMWRVLFLLRLRRNVPHETNEANRWLSVLLDAHRDAITLGGLVVRVRTTSWRAGVIDYNAKSYTGNELGLEAIISEPWSPTP